ncbi:MAG TPA: outer membrane beta-barrel protein [Ohtaekwangia sp.]|uniref:outer membrane beta-barrel protein n=1 Tax=Ohtaekwangia sp. TaxID=2066019 RepID=UPI002F928AE2
MICNKGLKMIFQYRKITFSFFIFSIIFYQTGYGQSAATVDGTVTDVATGEPIPFSSVAVYQKINSKDSLVSGTQSNVTGQFSVAHIPAGIFTVRISFVGYQTLDRAVTLHAGEHLNIGTLSLQAEPQVLKEVEIVAEKSDLQVTPDKRIFNVSNNMTALGGTAETLLRNVPSLTIDETGAASLRNMPTTIYIDGKPTQLTLAQIPANQIASVEVISNPSAKYDASTSGGIVNLVMKKNRAQGYNGMISAGIGNNSRYDATLNLDWQKRKWNLTTLYSLNSTRNPLTGYVHRRNKDLDGATSGYFDQNTDISLNNLFQSGRVQADYQADKNNALSIAGTIVGGAYNTVSNQTYYYRNATGEETSYGSRSTIPHNDYTNTGIELDWKHQFARKGKELHFMASRTHNRVSNAGDWYTTAYDINGTDSTSQDGYPVQNRIDGRIIGNQTLVQLDYTLPVNESVKWEFGLRSYTYIRDQEYFFNEVHGNEETLLQDYSQDARITETVNAAYALYNKQLSPKVNMQAGLRMEQSSLHGVSRFDGSTFGYNYPSRTGQNLFQSFFPSLAFNKVVNENSEWNFSLSRKVGRPNFRHVFVGIQANDRQNITIGNPAVRPEFVNTAELSYNKTWSTQSEHSVQWLPTAYYIYEDHTIKPIVTPLATDSTILVTTYQNVKADIRYGLDNTVIYSAGPLSILVNLNAYKVILQSVTLSNEMVGYNAKVNLTYKFPAGISAQASAQRRSKNPGLQGYQNAVNGVDFALRKNILQNKGNVTFSINDVFNSRRFVTIYDQPGVYQSTMNRREIRYFKLSVQLPLGRLSNGKMKERKVDRPDIDFSN